jgi:hypothetical protein
VLLVEDKPGDIFLIRQTLRNEPFPVNVTTAVDGEQATRIFSDYPSNPILLFSTGTFRNSDLEEYARLGSRLGVPGRVHKLAFIFFSSAGPTWSLTIVTPITQHRHNLESCA